MYNNIHQTSETILISHQARQAIDMKVLMNHIYEYKKGVRQMILFTCNKRYEDFAVNRLEHQGIDYAIQHVGRSNINIFFGRRQCIDAIRMIVNRPLCELTPEEDFIIGALLGYDICAQCERYCSRKEPQNVCGRILESNPFAKWWQKRYIFKLILRLLNQVQHFLLPLHLRSLNM